MDAVRLRFYGVFSSISFPTSKNATGQIVEELNYATLLNNYVKRFNKKWNTFGLNFKTSMLCH
jgi:hypothetical protein